MIDGALLEAPTSPVALRWSPHVPEDHAPHPPQAAFLWLDILEAFYGGAAGGGKSDALLMAALQYVDVPGYAALILRKTYADLALPGAIMDRAKTWLIGKPGVRWNENEKRFTFPSGATLSFGYLQTSNDKYRYQGAEFQFIGFDELTQFDEADYRYLFSRLRKPADVGADHPLTSVPLRMRSASNPGGRGHGWVKRRLVKRRPDPTDPTDNEERARRRVFIPARLSDNPSVDQRSYLEALALLDPEEREQLLNGDWDARPPGDYVYPDGIDEAEAIGARFDELLRQGKVVRSIKQQVVDRDDVGWSVLPPPVRTTIHTGTDYGENTHVLILYPLERGGVYVTDEIVQVGGEVSDICAPIAAAIDRLHPAAAGGTVKYGEARFDAAGIQSHRTYLRNMKPRPAKTVGVPFGNYKDETVKYIRRLLGRTAAGMTDGIIAISPRCERFLEQLRALEFADADQGKVAKGNDHGPDALIAGMAPIAQRNRKLPPAPRDVEAAAPRTDPPPDPSRYAPDDRGTKAFGADRHAWEQRRRALMGG